MNLLAHGIELLLPYLISVLEIMGIVVVAQSGFFAFWEYIQNIFLHKRLDLQFHLATGLATALEFKMAAEILKTVLIHNLEELLTLGLVILLRAILSVLIHLEMKRSSKAKEKL